MVTPEVPITLTLNFVISLDLIILSISMHLSKFFITCNNLKIPQIESFVGKVAIFCCQYRILTDLKSSDSLYMKYVIGYDNS